MVDPVVTSRFNEIYDSAYKPVVSFITARCRGTADIGDITQETFMELYRILSKRGADYPQNGKAMALKIARQKLARHYSLMERLRNIVPLIVENEDDDEMLLSDMEADAFLVEDFAVDRMTLESARQLLKQKPEDVKKIFYLFYDVDLTIAEIAKELSISESNVKHKLYRTLKEFRDLLQ
jgi:RNA polymerase sigma-70 factor (ECF subfamily)